MAKPVKYNYLKFSLLLLATLEILFAAYLTVSSNTGGYFLPKFSGSVTFVGFSVCVILVMGVAAALVNSIILLTSFAVIMGLVFVISLVAIIGAIIYQLLTQRAFTYGPFVLVVVLTIGFYVLTVLPLALKDMLRNMNVADGGDWDRRRAEETTFSEPLSLP